MDWHGYCEACKRYTPHEDLLCLICNTVSETGLGAPPEEDILPPSGGGDPKEAILAQEHWEYVKGLIDHLIDDDIREGMNIQLFEYLYKTAFIHGYKHGLEDK